MELCPDEELGYERSRTRFGAGQGLALDEAYRLAHLPLVAPDHPRVIPSLEGRPYCMGRRPRAYSMVLPVPAGALERSPTFTELLGELRSAPFAPKVAWEILDRRRDKLHATVCGLPSPNLDEDLRRELTGIGPFAVEIRGLFSGNVNLGRLYLRVYPERPNPLRRIQRILGCPESDVYLVGLFNLTDDLDPVESDALARLLDRWWDVPILRLRAESLWLLGSMDDLVLDGAVEETLTLSRPFGTPVKEHTTIR